MPTTATTIRLDAPLRDGLLKLSKLRSTTLNKMISSALRDFLANDTLVLQQEFEASIKDLQRLALHDPDFDLAIEKAVTAELSTSEDPAQGTILLPGQHGTTDLVRDLLSA